MVTNNLLDMWRQPKFESERVNQLFFGSVVEIVSSKAGYCRVIKEDGYIGWADRRLLVPVRGAALKKYQKSLNWIVTANRTPIFDNTGKAKTAPFYLYYGTKLAITSKKDGLAKVLLPDGTSAKVRQSSIGKVANGKFKKVQGKELTNEARKFLGVPYLWGGISSSGFDCSGLVQTICSRFGCSMPRDSKDQMKSGKKVSRSEIRNGDLLFFKGHVAFALSSDKIIHCSLAEGGIRISSLLSDKSDYREDLDKTFIEARRIL